MKKYRLKESKYGYSDTRWEIQEKSWFGLFWSKSYSNTHDETGLWECVFYTYSEAKSKLEEIMADNEQSLITYKSRERFIPRIFYPPLPDSPVGI